MVIIPASLFIVLLEKRDGYLIIFACLFIVLLRREILDIPARLFIVLVEEEDDYHTC